MEKQDQMKMNGHLENSLCIYNVICLEDVIYIVGETKMTSEDIRVY